MLVEPPTSSVRRLRFEGTRCAVLALACGATLMIAAVGGGRADGTPATWPIDDHRRGPPGAEVEPAPAVLTDAQRTSLVRHREALLAAEPQAQRSAAAAELAAEVDRIAAELASLDPLIDLLGRWTRGGPRYARREAGYLVIDLRWSARGAGLHTDLAFAGLPDLVGRPMGRLLALPDGSWLDAARIAPVERLGWILRSLGPADGGDLGTRFVSLRLREVPLGEARGGRAADPSSAEGGIRVETLDVRGYVRRVEVEVDTGNAFDRAHPGGGTDGSPAMQAAARERVAIRMGAFSTLLAHGGSATLAGAALRIAHTAWRSIDPDRRPYIGAADPMPAALRAALFDALAPRQLDRLIQRYADGASRAGTLAGVAAWHETVADRNPGHPALPYAARLLVGLDQTTPTHDTPRPDDPGPELDAVRHAGSEEREQIAAVALRRLPDLAMRFPQRLRAAGASPLSLHHARGSDALALWRALDVDAVPALLSALDDRRATRTILPAALTGEAATEAARGLVVVGDIADALLHEILQPALAADPFMAAVPLAARTRGQAPDLLAGRGEAYRAVWARLTERAGSNTNDLLAALDPVGRATARLLANAAARPAWPSWRARFDRLRRASPAHAAAIAVARFNQAILAADSLVGANDDATAVVEAIGWLTHHPIDAAGPGLASVRDRWMAGLARIAATEDGTDVVLRWRAARALAQGGGSPVLWRIATDVAAARGPLAGLDSVAARISWLLDQTEAREPGEDSVAAIDALATAVAGGRDNVAPLARVVVVREVARALHRRGIPGDPTVAMPSVWLPLATALRSVAEDRRLVLERPPPGWNDANAAPFRPTRLVRWCDVVLAVAPSDGPGRVLDLDLDRATLSRREEAQAAYLADDRWPRATPPAPARVRSHRVSVAYDDGALLDDRVTAWLAAPRDNAEARATARRAVWACGPEAEIEVARRVRLAAGARRNRLVGLARELSTLPREVVVEVRLAPRRAASRSGEADAWAQALTAAVASHAWAPPRASGLDLLVDAVRNVAVDLGGGEDEGEGERGRGYVSRIDIGWTRRAAERGQHGGAMQERSRVSVRMIVTIRNAALPPAQAQESLERSAHTIAAVRVRDVRSRRWTGGDRAQSKTERAFSDWPEARQALNGLVDRSAHDALEAWLALSVAAPSQPDGDRPAGRDGTNDAVD